MCKKILILYFIALSQFFPAVTMEHKWTNAEEYFVYVDKQKLPRVLIIGSGRGTVFGKEKYAQSFYGTEEAKNYLLVDVESKHIPDIVCSVLDINPTKFGGENQYDVIIFEHLPYFCAFTSSAIIGALNLLKPDGVLVSSNFPMPRIDQYDLIPKLRGEGVPEHTIASGIFFHNEDPETRQNMMNDSIFLKEDLTKDKKLEFLNNHSHEILSCLGADALIASIEFCVITKTSSIWPRKIDCPVWAMIIKRKHCANLKLPLLKKKGACIIF